MSVAHVRSGLSSLRPSRAGIIIGAFWAIAVLSATVLPMTDPDTFWHIRAGLEVLERGRMSTVDEWSIVGAGRTWVSQDWLSNVIMALGFRLGDIGPTVLSGIYGFLATAAIAGLWSAIGSRRAAPGWLSRAAWLLFGLVLAAPVLGVRVQVVDLTLAAAVMWVLWRYLGRRRAVELLALPALAVVWVNLHAGFPLLFLLGGAVLVGEALDRVLARHPEDGEPLDWPHLASLVGSLAIAAAALLINPSGYLIYAYPFDTLGITALSDFVGEWQPASLDVASGQLLAAFVVAGVVPSLLLGWRSMRSADALVLLGLVLMATVAVRFLLVSGPICAAVVCVVLSPRLASTEIGRRFGRLTTRWTRRDQGIRGALNALVWLAVVIAGLLLVGWRTAPDAQRAAIAAEYPVDAVRWLETSAAGGRTFNRYEWGGYLGLHLPHRPVFIDGRADVYGDVLIREYVETISVNVDPQAIFDRYEIDRVLYPADSTLGRWLDSSRGWRRAYEGQIGTIWVRRDG